MTEQELLAAEYALNLLEGDELLDARNRALTSRKFAEDVARWQQRLSPLFDEIPPLQTAAGTWAKIEHRISGEPMGEVRQLTRRVRFWQGVAASATAAAAAAVLFLVLTPQQTVQPPVPGPTPAIAPVLVASLASETGPTSLAVTFAASQREIVIAPGRVSDEAGRDHELWLIPAGAAPISLGTIEPTRVQRRQLTPAIAARVASGATVALSLEPGGGSRTGAPTGPVLAAGALNPV